MSIPHDYETAIAWAADEESTTKADIFKAARTCGDQVLLGIVDGVILRTSDNLVKGLVSQFGKRISAEDLVLCIEHAALAGRPEHIKSLTRERGGELLTFLVESIQYVGSKQPEQVIHLTRLVNASR
jgi:hypothetical protein